MKWQRVLPWPMAERWYWRKYRWWFAFCAVILAISAYLIVTG